MSQPMEPGASAERPNGGPTRIRRGSSNTEQGPIDPKLIITIGAKQIIRQDVLVIYE